MVSKYNGSYFGSKWEVILFCQRREALHILFVLSLLALFPSFAVAKSSIAGNAFHMAWVIGNNKGHGDLKPLSYAQKDARRFASVLTELSSFRPDNIMMQISPSLKQVKQMMLKIKRKLLKHRGKGIFIFYYSGHSQPTHFQLGKEALAFSEIIRFIRKLPVQVRLLVVDSCYSGRLVRVKGKSVRKKGAVRVNFINWSKERLPLKVKGLAILASSGETERSYESDRLQSSFFTSSLLAGLRGAADLDNNQKISLREAYEYARRQTMTLSTDHKVRMQRPVYLVDMKGSGSLFLTYLKRAEVKVAFDASIHGYCLMFLNQELVHEFDKKSGQKIFVAVRKGHYQIQVRRKNWVGVYKTKLERKRNHVILASNLQWHRINKVISDKAGFEPATIGFGFLLSYTPISQLSMHGFGGTVAFDVQSWLRFGIRYQFAALNRDSLPHQTHEIGLRLGVGYDLQFSRSAIWIGGIAEPRLTIRVLNNGEGSFTNIGGFWGAGLQYQYHITPELSLRSTFAGGGHLIFFDRGNRLTPAFDMSFGMMWHP